MAATTRIARRAVAIGTKAAVGGLSHKLRQLLVNTSPNASNKMRTRSL